MALSSSFVSYMETSSHLVFYRLGAYILPQQAKFPKVQSLSVVHCSGKAVSSLLLPSHFPSLRRIHYLSEYPEDRMIHKRWTRDSMPGNKVEWVFPDTPYPFYDRMVEAGYGRKDPWTVMNHVTHLSQENKMKWMGLFLPGRGEVEGEWFHTQQLAYLRKLYCDLFKVPYHVTPSMKMGDSMPAYQSTERQTSVGAMHPLEMYSYDTLEKKALQEILGGQKGQKDKMGRRTGGAEGAKARLISHPDATPFRS